MRWPGSWSHFCPCSRPPWPLPWPVIIDAARAFAADVAGGQRDGDHGPQFSTPLDWCSSPRACMRIARPRFAEPVRGALDGLGRQRPSSPPPCADSTPPPIRAVFSKPVVCCRDELRRPEAVAEDHVQHAHQQRQIRAGAHRQEQIGIARDRRHARIGDDQLPAVVAARQM